MKPLALASLIAVLAAVGCKSGSEESSSTGASGTPPVASGSGDAGATTATFATTQAFFTANCTGCHSGAGAKEGIDFSSYAGIMKGGHEGPVVVAGDPANSMVIKALRGNGAKQMPPGKTIPEDQIKAVEAWIQAGAKEN